MYITIVSGFVFFDLVDMLLSINLPYIILLSFILNIFFPQDFNFCFKLTVKIIKNTLCNGFKIHVKIQ